MLPRDGADKKKAEARSFDLNLIVGSRSVEALEDTLYFARRQAQAGIGDGQRRPCVPSMAMAAADVNTVWGVLHGVVQQVGNGRAQVFRICVDIQPHNSGHLGQGDVCRLKVVAKQNGSNAVSDERMKFYTLPLVHTRALAEFTSLEHSVHRTQQAIGVLAHDRVELLALGFVAGMTLQRFEIQANAGDGCLEFVRHRVEE